MNQICKKCGLLLYQCQCGWIKELNFTEVVYDEKDPELIREIKGPNFNDLVKKINGVISCLNDIKNEIRYGGEFRK